MYNRALSKRKGQNVGKQSQYYAQTPSNSTMDIETGGIQTKYDGSILTGQDDPEANDVILGDIPPWTTSEIFVTAMATVTTATAMVTMAISANPFVLISGAVGVLVPPYVAFQQQKITDCKEMEKTNAVMDRELNNLKHENERLEVENKKLETSVANLHNLTDIFEEISQMEGVSLDSLERQLKQSEQIVVQMEEKKLNAVLNNIFDILCAADDDGDMMLSDSEIDILIKSVEGIESVDIKDELAKRMIIDAGRGIDAVMQLIKNSFNDDAIDVDKIITIS